MIRVDPTRTGRSELIRSDFCTCLNKTSNKRFIIQHAKLLCPCGRISRIFIYAIFFVTSIQFVVRAFRENLFNRSSGVQIPRDICTRFGRYLYSTKCSWIIIAVTTFEVTFLGSGVGWGGLSLLLKPNHNSKIERHR